jgi:hypothetical protein
VSTSVPSWQVIEWTLTLPVPLTSNAEVKNGCMCIFSYILHGVERDNLLLSFTWTQWTKTFSTTWHTRNALVLVSHSADGAQSQRGTESLLVDTTVLLVFYGNTVKWDRFTHVLRFIHFSDNKNEPKKTSYVKWGLYLTSSVLHMLNTTAQLHILSPVEVTVLFEGRVFIKHAKEIQTAGDKSLQVLCLRDKCTVYLCVN